MILGKGRHNLHLYHLGEISCNIQVTGLGEIFCLGGIFILPYSRKYWRELNLVVGSQTDIAKYWWIFNLAVQYGITIYGFYLAIVVWDRLI